MDPVTVNPEDLKKMLAEVLSKGLEGNLGEVIDQKFNSFLEEKGLTDADLKKGETSHTFGSFDLKAGEAAQQAILDASALIVEAGFAL